jgi:phage shock protein C
MKPQPKQLFRSRTNRMLGGVCGGLGDYTNLDPTLYRLLFALGSIFGFGSLLIVYLVLLIVVPEEPMVQPTPPTQEHEAPTDQ